MKKDVQENLFKIQKIDDITFSDTYNKDGEEYGTCSNCNITGPIENHICMTIVEDKDEFNTTIIDFKTNNMIELTEQQIKYYNQLFNMQKEKYQTNKFFKSIHKQMNDNKRLSTKQYNQFVYMIKNGRSMYEDGILTTKN